MNKSWPSDSRVGCKPPSNLLKLIEKDIKKDLEEFENSLEWDEMKLWIYKMLEEKKNHFFGYIYVSWVILVNFVTLKKKNQVENNWISVNWYVKTTFENWLVWNV